MIKRKKSVSENRNGGHCVCFLSSLSFCSLFLCVHTISPFIFLLLLFVFEFDLLYNVMDRPMVRTAAAATTITTIIITKNERKKGKIRIFAFVMLLPIQPNGRKVILIYRYKYIYTVYVLWMCVCVF